MSLNSIAAAVAECRLCAELAATRTSVVVGDFPPGARLLLVGEAPGREEDETGRPFVGRAGRLLDELLADAGLVRSSVAVANVLKCRPPGNRAPTRVEVSRCRPWLDQQLTWLDPWVVVTLGATAAAWAFGRPVTLASVRGAEQLRDGRVVIPSYHPAAALRFGPAGAPRAGLAADLSSAAGRLEALSAGELVFGPATADAAAHVHALTTAAFRALPALDPPSGVFRETVDTVAAELTAQPGIAAYRFARMVGVLRLDVRAGALWLRRVAVDPTLHGSGIGSQLVDWTHDWARQAGFRSTRVGVRSGLDRPQRFWARHGYRPVATHDFWIEYERAG